MTVDVVLALGTRPEVIKMAPVKIALERRSVATEVWTTGQHEHLADLAATTFGLEFAKNLRATPATPGLNELWSATVTAFGDALRLAKPRLVVVQGDTTSGVACAVAASNERTAVAHVEAGLRSHDVRNPFPEETNRKIIGQIAEIHFTPTRAATENLMREGADRSSIEQVGNTSIDAAVQTHNAAAAPGLFGSVGGQRILVTLHRREALDEDLGAYVSSICDYLRSTAGVSALWPLHPNPRIRREINAVRGASDLIKIVEPLSYEQMIATLRETDVLVTDSGGLQEEASLFGIHTLVCRKATERMEAVDSGSAFLAPTSDQLRALLSQARLVRGTGELQLPTPFGDGAAATRIAKRIDAWISR